MVFVLDHMTSWCLTVLVVAVIIWLLGKTLQVIDQYERGVVLTLGKYSGTRGPGLVFLVPVVQTMRRADLRISVMEIAEQDLITKDNVSVKVTAVTYYKVTDAKKALLEVQNYKASISQLAQITLRSTLGKHSLDELLGEQDKLNETLRSSLAPRAHDWGVEVDHVEIRSVDLAKSMIRAMAQEAEAERGRRARRITAEGEAEAAAKLSEAAKTLSEHPAALTLRTLATLKEIGAENATTIVFPVSQDAFLPPSIAAFNAALKQT